MSNNTTLRFEVRLCVPNIPKLKKEILAEAYGSPYYVHPENTKMYQDLQDIYW